MAWDTEIVTKARYTINDIDSSDYTWTDSQIKTFILLATVYVASDLKRWNIAGTYIIDIVAQTITPDPTDEETDIVVNLIALKTAELISRAEFKKNAANAGIKVTDDRSSIDTTLQASNLSKIVDNYLSNYTTELQNYRSGVAFDGKAILSPYSHAVSGI